VKHSPLVVNHKPVYALNSVDRALKILQLLRDRGSMRLSDIAAELDVSPSTAHRLLAMLAYRGFAQQSESRMYEPGPGIGAPPTKTLFTDTSRVRVQRILDKAAVDLGGRINIGVLSRANVRVVASSACEAGDTFDSTGVVMRADVSAMGQAMLASLSDEEVRSLYFAEGRDLLPQAAFGDLLRRLNATRHVGYAINRLATTTDTSSVACAIRNPEGRVVAAISITVPSAKFDDLLVNGAVPRLRALATRLSETIWRPQVPRAAGAEARSAASEDDGDRI
jgi:DNA-binding IclR family transcriptional regulator